MRGQGLVFEHRSGPGDYLPRVHYVSGVFLAPG
jgi:hypothetical protein